MKRSSPDKQNISASRHIQFIRSLSILLIIPSVTYLIYNILGHNIRFAVITGIAGIGLLVVNLILFRTGYVHVASVIILTGIYAMVFFSLLWGKTQHYSLIWMTGPPAVTYYLLGSRRGFKINVAFVSVLFLFLLLQPRDIISYRSIANILYSIVFSSVVLYSYEKNRELREKMLEEKHRELERLSSTDSLTGLYNRTWIDRMIEQDVGEPAGSEVPSCSLILIDIDRFKRLNDTYGHQEGDKALKAAAKAIIGRTEGHGEAARWGGEEFLIFLRNMPYEDILTLAESIRSAVEQITFDNGMKITVSMGIAVYREDDTYDALLKRADDALYQAKQKGRNRIESAGRISSENIL